MILHVIHKSDRTDRKNHLENQMIEQGIDLVVWHDAVTDCKKVHQSIGESHKNVVRFAQEKGLKTVCIAEDDLHFPSPEGWKYFLSRIPQQFDIFVGGAYAFKITHDTYQFNSTILHKWSGMHLYIVHQKFYSAFLEADTQTHNIERAVALELQRKNKTAHICWPFAAVQAETPSDNIKGKIYKINDYFNRYNTYGF